MTAPYAAPSGLLSMADAAGRSAEVMARVARSFWAAARFFPADVRADVVALYAFCRAADDAVDEAPDFATARESLAALRGELLGERPPSPLIVAYRAVAARRALPPDCALLLLDGVGGDAGRVRVTSQDDLLRYCYRVASTVGLMMCRVVGCDDRHAAPHAVDLGIAMQLTNIVRDVAEDARRDRVYLPADLLEAHGVSAEDITHGRVDRRTLRRVTDELLALAERYYQSAEAGMHYIPWRTRVGVLVASRLYAAIGRRARRRAHDPLSGRMVVPRWEKLLWIVAGVRASLRSTHGRHPRHDPALHGAIAGWPGANPMA